MPQKGCALKQASAEVVSNQQDTSRPLPDANCLDASTRQAVALQPRPQQATVACQTLDTAFATCAKCFDLQHCLASASSLVGALRARVEEMRVEGDTALAGSKADFEAQLRQVEESTRLMGLESELQRQRGREEEVSVMCNGFEEQLEHAIHAKQSALLARLDEVDKECEHLRSEVTHYSTAAKGKDVELEKIESKCSNLQSSAQSCRSPLLTMSWNHRGQVSANTIRILLLEEQNADLRQQQVVTVMKEADPSSSHHQSTVTPTKLWKTDLLSRAAEKGASHTSSAKKPPGGVGVCLGEVHILTLGTRYSKLSKATIVSSWRCRIQCSLRVRRHCGRVRMRLWLRRGQAQSSPWNLWTNWLLSVERVKRWLNLLLKAMGGGLAFRDALRVRLNIIKLRMNRSRNFKDSMLPRAILTPGIKELIHALRARGTSVYLVSGGFRYFVAPVAQFLGLPNECVFCNELQF
eukprot:Em0015g636a